VIPAAIDDSPSDVHERLPMAEYLVLARKYRSATFDEVVGQQAIGQTLVNAIKTGRLAQAYLFTGTRGVGKTTVARILAKALNCLSVDAPTATPCNACDACEAIGRGDDIDVIEIDGASNRGIDEIRELRSNAVLRPARCRYKIYYIDEVHMLTREAFNALLKTLEEPPAHVKFIFATTEPAKIPATVLSRCQRFDFRNIPTADIAGQLRKICKAEKIEIDDAAVFRVAKAAAGSMRDGISLLDQLLSSATGKVGEADVLRVLGTPPEERISALLTAVAGGEAAVALEQLDEVLAAGYPLEGMAAALADGFRHVMLALTCGVDSRLIELSESQRQALGALAERFSLPAAVHAVGVCEQVMRNIRASSCARALAEAAVVRLAAAEKFVDPASLIERLEQVAGTPMAAGAATGAKKKIAGALPLRGSPPAAGRGGVAKTPRIEWNAAWLAENWQAVVGGISNGSVAGILRAAKPMAAQAGAIRLGFDAAHESMRKRAAGAMAGAIAEALAALAGRAVQCEFVSAGGSAANGAGSAGPQLGRVSSRERKAVESDPAVRAVMDLFGGQIADITHDVEMPSAKEAADSQEP